MPGWRFLRSAPTSTTSTPCRQCHHVIGSRRDPGITLKSALVVTPWPGATAAEMAADISEVLESEIQTMGEVDYITSRNRPGLSVIEVHVHDT